MFVERGVIEGFEGSWGSGLAYLLVSGKAVPCDNAPTVRALESAFGDVITDDHTAKAPVGQEIVYWLDEYGLILGGFVIAEDWDGGGYPPIPEGGLEFDPLDWQ